MNGTELPAGWRLGRLLEIAETRTSNVDKHIVEGQAAVWLCNYVDVYYNDIIDNSIDFMRATATANQLARFKLIPGDVVITKDSESADDIGIPAYVDVEASNLVCGYHLAIVRPNVDRVWPKFLFWAMRSGTTFGQWATLATGVTRVGIKSSDLARVRVPVPPLAEQRAIADFLDRETQQIDELIAEQRGLIETLRERRSAVISRAVRQGVDASVATVNSGVDWLGDVPTHWRVKRLKYSIEAATPGVWGADARGDASDVRCVRVADFDRAHLRVKGEVPTIRSVQSSDRDSRLLSPGDLLIEKSGGTATNPVGFVVMYEGPADEAVYANFISRMRPAEGQVARYWLYAHTASYITRLTVRSVKQTTGIQNLDQNAYFDESFPFPPADEQSEIAAFLDDQTARIDALIAESVDLIALSLERRAALITAAVTGQIRIGADGRQIRVTEAA